METVASVDHIQIQEEPASLQVQVAVTGMVAQAPHLLELVTVEAVVALVEGLEAALVQAVVPLGPMEVYSPLRLVAHHPVVEVGVVPATALAVVDMAAVHLAVEAQAIPLVALEVEEGMDPIVVEALPLDVEVEQVDIQVVPVEVMALHSRLQVEGDIPMAPHHHNHHLVVPATAKEAMTPRCINVETRPTL